VIFSTSVPYSAHVAAYLAARWRGVPWIAELRDPWSTAAEELLPTSKLRRKLDRALERFLLARADHVVVTSETTRSNLLRAHPALDPVDVTVVMNGFVPTPDGERPRPDEPCCFVFAGTVPEGERPHALLNAFAQVEASSPGRFRFRVFGPPEPWTVSSMATPKWLELGGVVTPGAARQAIAASNAAVLLQHFPGRAQVVSGKAFEYIGARRPIIAVLPPGCEMAKILAACADARIVASYDVDDLAAQLERVIAEHSAGLLREPKITQHQIAHLSRDGQARILDGILLRLEGT
jgi:glycosyltransferase involved in cell wall biosynthesis